MTGALVDRICLAAVLGLKTLDHRAGIDPGLRDIQRVLRRGDFLLVGIGDGENSPSLWPTMSSCTNTRKNLLPLWTSNVWPTNSGIIVQARAQVFTGVLARFSFMREILR